MNNISVVITFCFFVSALMIVEPPCLAQDYLHYTGKTMSNADDHHGQLTPIISTHNIQTIRENRKYPEKNDDFGWTYNHAPMLAYWNNTFYLQHLSNEISEHVPHRFICVAVGSLEVEINGKKESYPFFVPVESIERIVFRTGNILPTIVTSMQNNDLPDADESDQEADYYIPYLKIGK